MKAVPTVFSIFPRKGSEANLGEGHLIWIPETRGRSRQIGGEATS